MQRAAEAAQAAENARLLYVAMTRAQDRLIVAGGGNKMKTPDQVGWGAVIKGALEGIGAKAVATPFGEGLALGAPLAEGAAGGRTSTKTPVLPAWTHAPPPAAPGRSRTVAPSRLLDPTPPERVASPLFPTGTGRAAAAARGRVIHKLLQTLPDVAADRRNEAARAFLSAQPDLDPAERDAIASEVFGVLSHPDLTDVFGSGSRAEAAVAGTGPGLPEGAVVSGQVDRLLVTPERVTIVDFKSNRPPPQEVAGVSRVYLAQIAAYRAVFRGVDPDRPVDCVLVWTHAPSVMALPDSALDAAWGAG